LTITADPSPVAVPAAPLNVGLVFVVEVPVGGDVSETPGGVVSTVHAAEATALVFPAASVARASKVWLP
jgi:hypothetical protein